MSTNTPDVTHLPENNSLPLLVALPFAIRGIEHWAGDPVVAREPPRFRELNSELNTAYIYM
jgi:hypothetical protein